MSSRNLIFTLLLLPIVGYSQNEQIEFDYFRIENGLPNNTINDIIQDSLGYLWLATNDGATYFNNYTFKVFRYNKSDSNSIRNNQVYKLHIGSQGKIWLGTKQSLERYDPQTGMFKHFYLSRFSTNDRLPIIDILQTNDSTLLIATDGGGLQYFNTNNYSHGNFLPVELKELTGDRITSIIKDKHDRFWIGTRDKGVVLFTPNVKFNQIQKLTPDYDVRKIIQYSANEILVATYGKGILRININDLSTETYHQTILKNNTSLRVFDILKKDNYLYIGTDGDGLLKYNIETDKTFTYKNYGTNTKSVSNNVIRKIFIDDEQGLWLGHYQGGLSLSRNKNLFKNIKHSPIHKYSLSNPNATAILVDKEGLTWIGTDGGGINIIKNENIHNNLNNNTKEVFKGSNPLYILSLYEDNENNIWIGTYLDGIYIYNPNKSEIKEFNTLYPALKISDKDIRCITQDRSGKIWIGTNGGGVNVLDLKENTNTILINESTNSEHSLTVNWIRTIFEDKYGYIWIGTTYGLNVYDPHLKTFRRYLHTENDSNSISGDFIFSISEDQDGQLWVGTTSGLNKYDRQTDRFTNFTIADGLPSDIINSIVNIDQNSLWLSTNYGLSEFNPKTETVKNYNITDGLACNSFLNGAFYSDNDKTLYYGSTAGLTFFNPDKLTEIDYEIPIIITDLKIFNQSLKAGQLFNEREILRRKIAFTETITLLKKENVISLDFTALSYSYSDKIEYKYRLLGFSDKWNTVTKKPSVTYTNLESGNYTFQVRVGNLGDHHPIRNLHITILSPFYETWWFKITCTLFIAFIIISAIRFRIRTIKNQRDLLKQKYEIQKMTSEQERIHLNVKIKESQTQFRKDEMNYKNSQLISTTTLLMHKNEKMNYVKNKINVFVKEVDDLKLKNELKSLIETINNHFKVEEDWKRFEEHFNHVHKDFITELKQKHPDLSLPYLRLCAYLKLDLSTKEIAALMNISQRGVEKARSRLRKKLSLNSNANLITFITKI